MKLSVKSEYACLALIDLAQNSRNERVKIEKIANRNNIPRKYLEQIMLSLKNAGFLNSKKGAEGGYKLAKSPEQINIAQVIRLMDGALAPVESASKYFYESTPIEKNKKLLKLFKEIRDYVSKKLEKTTLKELMNKK